MKRELSELADQLFSLHASIERLLQNNDALLRSDVFAVSDAIEIAANTISRMDRHLEKAGLNCSLLSGVSSAPDLSTVVAFPASSSKRPQLTVIHGDGGGAA